MTSMVASAGKVMRAIVLLKSDWQIILLLCSDWKKNAAQVFWTNQRTRLQKHEELERQNFVRKSSENHSVLHYLLKHQNLPTPTSKVTLDF